MGLLDISKDGKYNLAAIKYSSDETTILGYYIVKLPLNKEGNCSYKQVKYNTIYIESSKLYNFIVKYKMMFQKEIKFLNASIDENNQINFVQYKDIASMKPYVRIRCSDLSVNYLYIFLLSSSDYIPYTLMSIQDGNDVIVKYSHKTFIELSLMTLSKSVTSLNICNGTFSSYNPVSIKLSAFDVYEIEESQACDIEFMNNYAYTSDINSGQINEIRKIIDFSNTLRKLDKLHILQPSNYSIRYINILDKSSTKEMQHHSAIDTEILHTISNRSKTIIEGTENIDDQIKDEDIIMIIPVYFYMLVIIKVKCNGETKYTYLYFNINEYFKSRKPISETTVIEVSNENGVRVEKLICITFDSLSIVIDEAINSISKHFNAIYKPVILQLNKKYATYIDNSSINRKIENNIEKLLSDSDTEQLLDEV